MQLIHYDSDLYLSATDRIRKQQDCPHYAQRHHTMNGDIWQQAFQQAPVGMLILSPEGKVIHCNPEARHFWGEDSCCHPQTDIPALLDTTPQALLEHFRGQDTPLVRTRHLQHHPYLKESGNISVWLRFTASPLRNEAGQLTGILISHQDISDEAYYRRVIENTAQGVSAVSGQNFFESLVTHLAQIFDARYAFIGLLNNPESPHREIRTMALSANGMIADNFSYALKDTPCDNVFGQETCAICSNVQTLFPDDILLQEMNIEGYIGSPIFDPRGEPLGIMVVMDTKPLERVDQVKSILEIFAARAGAEIQRLDAEQQVRRMAYEDYLTSLPNRASLYKELQQHRLHNTAVTQPHAALFMIDLDHFKTINDALGHDIGDEIIRKAGERLRLKLPETLFISRIGGDEFVVLLTDDTAVVDAPQIQLLSEKILYLLSQPFQIGDRIINIGASVGAVCFPQTSLGPDYSELDLMRYADIALYQAKSAGRNQCVIYSPEHQQAVNERLDIERGLREALETDQLKLFMQPQVDPQGQMRGAEVLLRWQHPEQGMIPPFRFIPIAEETGLILRVGHFVLDKTLGLLASWQQQHIDAPQQISVNVSAWQFSQPDFVPQTRALCEKWQIHPKRIMLEVTETALLQDIAETRLKLQALRQTGFKISLDDFGTGYSSLAYLRDLPLDELKIDKSFIDEVQPGHRQPLVESMIAIGKYMKLDVVAEGVETAEQAEQLEQMGCIRYQGYHFARPMPAEELPAWAGQQAVKA